MLFITITFLIANAYILIQEYFEAKQVVQQAQQIKYKLLKNVIVEELQKNKETYFKRTI